MGDYVGDDSQYAKIQNERPIGDVVGVCLKYHPRVVFTARHNVKRGVCRRRVSVCLCICLTHRYCIKTAKRNAT